MSNEIQWPTKPFYIMSKISLSNWALVASGAGLTMKPLSSSIDQLWTATPDARGGARLKHVNSGLYLSATLFHWGDQWMPAGPLKMESLDTSKADELWRVEDVGGGWVGINSLLNWEAKVNVYGSNPHGTIGLYKWDGGENEVWKLVQETGEVTVVSVHYDMSRAVADLSLPPNRCQATIINNIGGQVPQTGSYAIQRSVTTTHSVTNSESDTTGHKYTQTFSIKGGLDKVVEVSASASFEESDSKTISLTDQKTDSITDTDTLTINVNAPAGRKYSYQVVVHYGKCTVPYTAQMRFQSVVPGSAPVLYTSEGIFTGVNQTRNEVETLDITDKAAAHPTLVSRVAVAKAAAH